MEANTCPKCSSKKIVPRVRVMDRGHYSGDAGDLALVIYENPEALIFKGTHEGALYAQVCGECGYTELYLDNPQELYSKYKDMESKRGKISLD